MNYKNAGDIIPPLLLTQIQQYCDGCVLYVPLKGGEKSGWGAKNGTRSKYAQRNREIREKFRMNIPARELAAAYYLSVDSIRKIVSKSDADI